MVGSPNKSASNYLAFAAVATIWGTTWAAIKMSLQGYPPFAGAMLRFVVAIVVLISYGRLRGVSFSMPRKSMRWIVVTAVLLYVVDYGLVYWSEQSLNAGVTAILFAALPLATALVSAFGFGSEILRPRRLAGILCGFGGILAIFFDQFAVTGFNLKVTLAAVAVIVAAVAAALNITMAKRHLMEIDAVSLTVHQMVWGSLCLGIIASIRGEWHDVHYSFGATTALAYLGVAGSAVAFVLYYSLLKRMSASALSTMTYFTPLIAVFSGGLLLNESISGRVGVGVSAIFAGIALVQFDELSAMARRRFAPRWPKVGTES